MHIHVEIYSKSMDECLLYARQILKVEDIEPNKINSNPGFMEFLV